MDRSLGLKTLIALAISGTFMIQPVSAQPASKKKNWMAEYVALRVAARTLRSVTNPGALQASLTQPRIVGGTPAGANDNPFQVGLLRKNEKDNFQAQFCGGTLIGPSVVVTAAHCSDFVTNDEVQVLSDTRKLDGSGIRHDVTSIAIHPNWDPDTFDHDVAVWKLASSATGTTFATLAASEAQPGVQLLATGWGQLTQGGGSPIDLMKVQVPAVAFSNCNDANSYNGAITDRMFCAGLETGGKDTCQGDSGGPLTGGAGNRVLNGITSFGIGCAQPNLFGVYTKVANATIRQFIEHNK